MDLVVCLLSITQYPFAGVQKCAKYEWRKKFCRECVWVKRLLAFGHWIGNIFLLFLVRLSTTMLRFPLRLFPCLFVFFSCCLCTNTYGVRCENIIHLLSFLSLALRSRWTCPYMCECDALICVCVCVCVLVCAPEWIFLWKKEKPTRLFPGVFHNKHK